MTDSTDSSLGTITEEELNAASEEERKILEEYSDDAKTEEDVDGSDAEEGVEDGESEEEADTGTEDDQEDSEDESDSPEDNPQEAPTEADLLPDIKSESETTTEADTTDVEDKTVSEDSSIEHTLKELHQQFEEGDISFENFLSKRDELKDQLVMLKIKEQVQQEFELKQEQALKTKAADQWATDQKAFFDINADILKDKKVFEVFKQQANIKITATQYSELSNTQLLEDAGRETRAILGMKQEAEKTVSPRQKIAKNESKKSSPSLKDTPVAASHEDENEFAHIDKLMSSGNIDELETALSKMSPAQQTRYLSK